MAEKQVLLRAFNVRKGEVMIAVCDCELLGKKFKEGKLVLDVCRDFYGGKRVSLETAVDTLRAATLANLVGEESIRCGIEAGIIHSDCVLRVDGVPHAQFVLI
ncbi:MAG: DUF424 family protein [Candidatus Methanomethylicus sp.]|nr:DUF424 family protein [Candidatus Methanomethylicus sp.]